MKHETKAGLDRYAEKGIQPGGFLWHVLSNDLSGAVGAADLENQRDLVEIVTYVYNKLPADCWGSPDKVRAWLTPDENEPGTRPPEQTYVVRAYNEKRGIMHEDAFQAYSKDHAEQLAEIYHCDNCGPECTVTFKASEPVTWKETE